MSFFYFVLSEDGCGEDLEPFQLLSGENIEYIGNIQGDFIIAVSNYRLFATQVDGFYSVSYKSLSLSLTHTHHTNTTLLQVVKFRLAITAVLMPLCPTEPPCLPAGTTGTDRIHRTTEH